MPRDSYENLAGAGIHADVMSANLRRGLGVGVAGALWDGCKDDPERETQGPRRNCLSPVGAPLTFTTFTTSSSTAGG